MLILSLTFVRKGSDLQTKLMKLSYWATAFSCTELCLPSTWENSKSVVIFYLALCSSNHWRICNLPCWYFLMLLIKNILHEACGQAEELERIICSETEGSGLFHREEGWGQWKAWSSIWSTLIMSNWGSFVSDISSRQFICGLVLGFCSNFLLCGALGSLFIYLCLKFVIYLLSVSLLLSICHLCRQIIEMLIQLN